MTDEECERITAAAKRAAEALPPMTAETGRRIARLLADAIREADEREAGSAA